MDAAPDGPTPSYIDPTTPSTARMYDYALGGKDHYEIDRETVRRLDAVAPEVTAMAVENRQFLIRALRFIASKTGILQYLDCGSGLPTAENTHQVVQRLQPEARVVYVDNDPTVLAHGRALLEDNDRTLFLAADVFTPSAVLDDPQVRRFLNFDEPIALIQNATLHQLGGPQRSAQATMREYVDALASGSYLVISHPLDPQDDGEVGAVAHKMEEFLSQSPLGRIWFRTQAEIDGLFAGCELVEPGVGLCAEWWPDGPRLTSLTPVQRVIVGGVGRKP